MKRILWGSAAYFLLLGGTCQAGLNVVIDTNPAHFAFNDSAGWGLFGPVPTSSTTSGLGTFSWDAVLDADPFSGTNVLLRVMANNLFVGTTSMGPGSASYVVDAAVDYGGQFSVTGFGFYLDRVIPSTQLTVYDVQGNSQTFMLGRVDFPTTFLGVKSNLPLAGFQFAESVVDASSNAQAILSISGGVQIEVAPVPEPPRLVLGADGRPLRRWLRPATAKSSVSVTLPGTPALGAVRFARGDPGIGPAALRGTPRAGLPKRLITNIMFASPILGNAPTRCGDRQGPADRHGMSSIHASRCASGPPRVALYSRLSAVYTRQPWRSARAI